ncbi:RBBP9/YdeN family alpha/beta hydrolase [Mangrovivirga cuniculi]|uniref:Alpha/beta hydrolase n=1 Tax=Mangrovivirga cuniculi TaxID=2715131 RepID=A0A4D7JJM6_9BACT|nr:alpha/beta hydrolase [Mangrovivirga cuniculi]QCK15801.1 alpha/beta hydrolase [Mangrovivirga cuniculi]
MKVNIPGLHNSDENHWQTLLEKTHPEDFIRINQENWDQPECNAWINKIERDLLTKNHLDLILIGHSIGCIAIVKWVEKFGHAIKGALLVAPSDSENENYPSYIKGFTPIPKSKLPFPTLVVGSTNDHVTTVERTKEFAANWGSKLIMLEDAGHIEPKSGFGPWPQVEVLIKELE